MHFINKCSTKETRKQFLNEQTIKNRLFNVIWIEKQGWTFSLPNIDWGWWKKASGFIYKFTQLHEGFLSLRF